MAEIIPGVWVATALVKKIEVSWHDEDDDSNSQTSDTTQTEYPQPEPPQQPDDSTTQAPQTDNDNSDDDDDDEASYHNDAIWQRVQQTAGGVGDVLKRQHDQAQQEAAQNAQANVSTSSTNTNANATGTYMGVPVQQANITPIYQTDLLRHINGLPTMSAQDIANYPNDRDVHQEWVNQQFKEAANPNINSQLAKVIRQYHFDTSGLGNQGVRNNQVAYQANPNVRMDVGQNYGNTGYMFMNHDSYQASEFSKQRELAKGILRSQQLAERANKAASKVKYFPTNPNLPISAYPDVTQDLLHLRDQALFDCMQYAQQLGPFGLTSILIQNFPTNHPWDIKSLPNFPGVDAKGNTQYAAYKGYVVPCTYLTNNFYGQVLAACGFPEKLALEAANRYFQMEVNDWRASDQSEDLWAIKSGYDDYFYKNPWLHVK